MAGHGKSGLTAEVAATRYRRTIGSYSATIVIHLTLASDFLEYTIHGRKADAHVGRAAWTLYILKLKQACRNRQRAPVTSCDEASLAEDEQRGMRRLERED